MHRKRVRRHTEQPREIACRKALGLMPDKRTERLKAGGLRKGCESRNGVINFHTSRVVEITRHVNKDLEFFSRTVAHSSYEYGLATATDDFR